MSVSLCLMVRNEEKKLAACLQSASDLVDETIVVDTGSTDGTRELAAKQEAFSPPVRNPIPPSANSQN